MEQGQGSWSDNGLTLGRIDIGEDLIALC